MSSKEIKALLKEAREAIKSKEYQVAIRKSKVSCETNNLFFKTYLNIKFR